MHSNKLIIICTALVSFAVLAFSNLLQASYEYHLPLVGSGANSIQYHQLSKEKRKQIDCLAENIYYEAGNQSREGKMAVAFVTINRMESGKFPSTICGVVHQKTGEVYQFSWVAVKNRLSKIPDSMYNDILQLATMMYFNHEQLKDITDGAMFYHADYVNPGWKGLKKTKVIGQHIFYREPI
jgi:spore germination cell wall hydrolase CwlJ-like protein